MVGAVVNRELFGDAHSRLKYLTGLATAPTSEPKTNLQY